MTIFFWICAATLGYAILGYPLLLALNAAVRPRPLKTDGLERPLRLAVLIAAFNEADAIEEKIRSVLAQRHEPHVLRCVLVSDGSTDDTAALARALASTELTVIEQARTGKAAALNLGLSQIDDDIVVFTDANSILAGNAIAALVAPFADPAVGGVAGDQRYRTDRGAEGERLYWSLDRLTKVLTSRSGNVTSATGALYAVRRNLIGTVPEGVTDDFAVSTGVVAQGHRLVFAADAVAYEPPASALTSEYRRKVRVITRGLPSLMMRRSLLNPFRTGFYAVQLFSAKLLRRLTVLPLLGLFVSSLFLFDDHWLYAAVAVSGSTGIALGLLSLAWPNAPRPLRPVLAIAGYVLSTNVAALHAVVNLTTGRRVNVWNPERESVASP